MDRLFQMLFQLMFQVSILHVSIMQMQYIVLTMVGSTYVDLTGLICRSTSKELSSDYHGFYDPQNIEAFVICPQACHTSCW
jgi:hypothetical protein